MNRVVHFEIQADNPERAASFYRAVFGWGIEKVPKMEGYWLVMTAPLDSKEPGINGGLLKRRDAAPEMGRGANAFVCTVEVQGFDVVARNIVEAGGTIAIPKHVIAGIAWQGYFFDPEGNLFGIHEPDTNAS